MLDISKVKEEGNSLLITTYPAIGVVTLTGFVEITSETVSDNFSSRSFRYSRNSGIDFSDWVELTEPNITALEFEPKEIIIFEISYTRNTPGGQAAVTSFSLNGTQNTDTIEKEYFDRSIFSYFFTNIDVELLQWTTSVLQKMYYEGLLAKFISRENKDGSNEDFIILWRTIAHFYAYYVIYARKFEKFYENRYLLSEFLKQRGLAVSPNDSLEQLQILMSRYSHQIFNRGTNHINDKTLDDAEVNGELLRLIQFKDEDEFQFNLHKTEHFGWNLGNSSPLWRGLYLNDNLQKYKADEYVVVDHRNDYEFSFFIKTSERVTISVDALDNTGASMTLKSHRDGSATNKALDGELLYRSDKDIFIRVGLYNSAKPYFPQDTLNINIGHDLILPENVAKVKLRVLDEAGNELEITQPKFLPMMTPFSHGVIQVYNWITCWLEQNNYELSLPEVKAFIRKYLIPYNSHIELIDLLTKDPYIAVDEPVTTTTRRLGWRGIQPACEYVIQVLPTTWIGGDYICEENVERLGWRGQEETAECIEETTTTTTTATPPIIGFGDIVLVYQDEEYQEWQSWTDPPSPIDMTGASILDFAFRNKSTGEVIKFTEAYPGAPGTLAMDCHKYGDASIRPIINEGPVEGEILVYGGIDIAGQIDKDGLSGQFIIYITQVMGYLGPDSPIAGTLAWVVEF